MFPKTLRKLVKPRRTAAEERLSITRAELDSQMQEFEDWRSKNPGRPARDWYSERMQAHLLGETHSTIGGNLRAGEFEGTGRAEFGEVIRNGLTPDQVCVDYGCGTLRVGQHLIRYLGAGAYWGFDIAQPFLDAGRALIGDELIAEKKPNLRVISKDSVAEAASKRPQMLFSLKVMQHVHPEELRDYLQDIVTIIGTSGQAFLFTKWSDSDTVQYKPMGWAHAFASIEGVVTSLGAKISILRGKPKPLPLVGAGEAMSGALRLVRS